MRISRRDFLSRAAGTSGALLAAPAATLLDGCRQSSQPQPSPPPSRPAGGRLRAQGGRLLDAQRQEVRLTGVNWFGLETSLFAPHGLWSRNWQDMLDQIAAAGFNTLRLPFSNQLLEPQSMPTSIDFTRNPDLRGLSGVQVMDRIIQGAAARRLWVLLDRHRPTADAQSELWYTDRVPEARWIADWIFLALRYRDQPAVIGADLHNEPHGPATWGGGDPRTDWAAAAERAGNAILRVSPEWLIVVEGVERYENDFYWWGGNLDGAQARPIRLEAPGRLVYSAHDYGPGVFGQPWFSPPTFPHNLSAVWTRHWAYLAAEDRAPVLMGEFGGRSVGQDPEGQWQRELVAFLKREGISYTYWSWNPDSGDTGGLLEDDWQTLNPDKLALLQSYQWPRAARLQADGIVAAG